MAKLSEFHKALASAFSTRAEALELLEKAGLPAERLLSGEMRDPFSEWAAICRKLEAGLVVGGLERLRLAAATLRPGNPAFRRPLPTARRGELIGQMRGVARRLGWTEGRAVVLGGLVGLAAFGLLKWRELLEEVMPAAWVWVGVAVLGLVGLGLFGFVGIRLVKLARVPSLEPVVGAVVVRGALALTPQDGELFSRLGRGEELGRLHDAVLDDQVPLVVVMGESGVGKTSLVRAGLQNVLTADVVAYWEAVPSQCLERLGDAVRSQLGGEVEVLERGVVVVDQAEQLSGDRKVFSLLEKHLQSSPPFGVTWVLVMRREFYPDWIAWLENEADLEESARQRVRRPVVVERFSRRAADGVFTVLAEDAGLQVREEVQAAILENVAEGGRVSPVDLAIALQVLARNPEQAGSLQLFRALGGHDAMLVSYLEGVLEPLDEAADRDEMHRALLELVDLESDQRLAEGLSLGELEVRVGPAVGSRFSGALRMLAHPGVRVVEVFGDDGVRFRIVHERFIPAIRRLAGRLLDAADRASRLLARRYAQWREESESRQFLLMGRELRTVELQLGRLKWGRDRSEKEQYLRRCSTHRRKRWVYGGVGALIGMVGISVVAYLIDIALIKKQLKNWGFPEGIYEAIPQVTELTIETEIAEWAWLRRASALQSLTSKTRNLSSLYGLPRDLSQLTLVLSFSQVSNLEHLPAGLSYLTLDLTHALISNLEHLPDGLSRLTLDLSKSQVSSLDHLPDGLSQLVLTLGSSQVASLEHLPDKLAQLTLDLSDSKISSLAHLPDRLSHLTLGLNRSRVSSLEHLPEGLSHLTLILNLASQIPSLEYLPSGLSHLTLELVYSQVSSLVYLLDGLPPHQLTLNLKPVQLPNLEHLPRGLSQLTLDLSASQVSSLEHLPGELTHLTLSLAGLQVLSLEHLPDELTHLDLDLSYSQVANLEHLPSGLSQLTLDLSGSQVLSLEHLPEGLSHLALDFSYSQVSSLEHLPEGLSHLTLDLSSSQVSSLEHLPEGLSHLTLDLSSSQVSSLEHLPEGLSHLTLDLSSSQVSSLEHLPCGLSHLTLDLSFTQMSSLEQLPDGIAHLSLDLNESQIKNLKIPDSVTEFILTL